MSSEVPRTLKIGDFAQVKGGKRMPAGTSLVSVKTKHPYLRIVDFKDGTIEQSNLQYVPEDVFPKISRYTINSDELYISIVGTIGLVGSVPRALSGANLTENAAKICQIDESKVDARYLGYFLRSDAGQDAIKSLTVGSTQPKLALFRIEQIEVPCPSLDVQQGIAEILGSLDDRITLLRETNTTLEAIAQALFKSWFVDFDPVRAKMEGRVPEGMDEATAALFPDSFEETELGLVPKGWQICCVDDVASLKGGKQLEKEHFKSDGLYPVFGGAGVMGRSNLFNAEGFVITVGRVGAYCGQYFWTQGKAWVNNNASLVSAKTEANSVWLLHWLKSVDMDVIKKGAAQPFVSNSDIASLKMAFPPEKLVDHFIGICDPIFSRISELSSQAQTLTNIRDILLPLLISGKLRVLDAESQWGQ